MQVVHEWNELSGENERLDTLKAMELARFDRIADELEDISISLKYLEDLGDAARDVADLLGRCENAGPWGSMLAISGTVETR